jgi:protein phosphatase PTC7
MDGSDAMSQVHASLGSTAWPAHQQEDRRPARMLLRRPFATSATVSQGQEPATGTGDGDQKQQQQQQGSRAHNPALLLTTAAALLPHPDKAYRGGEDWYFIASHQQASGVADGVGGWAEVGVDAGAYARSLMEHAKREAEASAVAAGASNLCSQHILEHAYVRVDAQGEPPGQQQSLLQLPRPAWRRATLPHSVHPSPPTPAPTCPAGSSTACVLVVKGATLHASNVGDSGFLVVRAGKVAFQCPQQQHRFNFPYQLGSLGSMSDKPEQAMVGGGAGLGR